MENQIKKALQIRFEYYNLYEGKEEKWHQKYKEHNLYEIVIKSFEYDFKEIGQMMPKLVRQNEENL